MNYETIMYDPLSYLCPERLCLNQHFMTSASARSAVNQLLIDLYQLSVETFRPDVRDLLWMRNWPILPAVAFLAGCYVHSAQLMWGGRYLHLPEWAQKFIMYHCVFATSHPVRQHKPGYRDILISGYACLQHASSGMTLQLQQRLPLLFPEWVLTSSQSCSLPYELLIVIMNHVKKNQITYTPERHR